MRDSPFRSAVDGNREFGCPVGREEGAYTDQLSSTPFTSQDHHTSRGGQSFVSEYPEIDPYFQPPLFHYSPSHGPGYYQDSPTPETLEASASNKVIHSPPVYLHPTASTPEIQAYSPCDVQVADHTCSDRTEVEFSTRRFEGSYTDQISSTAFNSQDHHESRGGQSIVSGYPGIDPYFQPPPSHYSPSNGPGYYQDSPTPETLEASASNKVIHSPPVYLHPTASTPEIQAYPPCDMQVTDHTYDRTEVDFSTRQFPPALYERTYTHRISSTAFTSQDHHASRGGQSFVSGYPGIDPCVQPPPSHYSPSHGSGYYQDSPTPETLEASVSNKVIHTPPVDLHPTALTPEVQAYHPYNVQVTDHTYERTEVDSSTRRFLLPPYTDHATFGHEGGGRFGSPPPFPNPSPDQHHIRGRLSSATPERNGCFHERKEEFFSDSGGMRQPYSVATESPPPTLKVTHRRNVRRRTGASASDPAGGVGDRATEMLAGSPLVDDFGSQTPKKRKLAATPDEKPGVKCADRWGLRRSSYIQESTKVFPPAVPPTSLHLLVVEQDQYKHDVTGWTPLEAIDFKVKGVKGMRLIDAVNLRFNGPDERDEPMFQRGGTGTSVSCRIHFSKYTACSRPRQIVTTDHKKERAPITKEKLAHEVAKCIDFYLMELEDNGTPFRVRFEDMYLTRLINVSRASWQPEICQVDPSVSS